MVVQGENISCDIAHKVMNEIMDGNTTDAQIAAFCTAIKIKGESSEEIYGCALAMREHAFKLSIDIPNLVDTCGTGGDCKNTINVSTLASFVACGAGITIAKHGNRAVSSSCGSADILEALGIKIDMHPKHVEKCLQDVGMVFLFAPVYHSAMKHAAQARNDIGMRTIFNMLGPLTNPLHTKKQLIGVYDPSLTVKMAEVLHKLGTTDAFVVHGLDGLDEVSLNEPTIITELRNGSIKTYEFHPQKHGIKRSGLEGISALTREDNYKKTQALLNGEDDGPISTIVLINAAYVIMVSDKTISFDTALEMAKESLSSGKAYEAVQKLKEFTHEHS